MTGCRPSGSRPGADACRRAPGVALFPCVYMTPDRQALASAHRFRMNAMIAPPPAPPRMPSAIAAPVPSCEPNITTPEIHAITTVADGSMIRHFGRDLTRASNFASTPTQSISLPEMLYCHDIDDMIERVAVVFALAVAFGPMIAMAIKSVLED